MRIIRFKFVNDFCLYFCSPGKNKRIRFVSLNRFERKKNIGLAVRAVAGLRERCQEQKKDFQSIQLILAGRF
jgi:hypothetical protein